LTDQKYANPYTTAYEFLNIKRMPVLYKAFTRIDESYKGKIRDFEKENEHWLPAYALNTILKEAYCGKEWYEWEDEDLKFYHPAAVQSARKKYQETILFLEFIQYVFYKQWAEVKAYASEKKVSIMGDLPMYVARQSSDVWSNRGIFDLTPQGSPSCVAGVPPDYFSELGQKWGNPLYRFDEMKKDGYRWWMDRLTASFNLFDVVRIDHFRAFSAYWAVPYEAETAKEGEWRKGPGMDFFNRVQEILPNAKIVAEDLGMIDDDVINLVQATGFPSMRVMQFGFLEEADNIHLPHNYPQNAFAYTGTHDNNTLLGWLWEAAPVYKKHALDYCGFQGENWADGGFQSPSCRALIRTLWQSPASVTIVPIQDLCGFGGDTKMNIPGVPNGNWAFRISREHLGSIDWQWLKKLNHVYYR
ncbi:MAG: 4-alpha-glucanotransferase, partial [Oscillospiraceae bacterium]